VAVALEQELEDCSDPGVLDLVELAVRGIDIAEDGFGARGRPGRGARMLAAPGTQSASSSAFVNRRSVAILRLLSALAASSGVAIRKSCRRQRKVLDFVTLVNFGGRECTGKEYAELRL
jgi:hypothetical protein